MNKVSQNETPPVKHSVSSSSEGYAKLWTVAEIDASEGIETPMSSISGSILPSPSYLTLCDQLAANRESTLSLTWCWCPLSKPKPKTHPYIDSDLDVDVYANRSRCLVTRKKADNGKGDRPA